MTLQESIDRMDPDQIVNLIEIAAARLPQRKAIQAAMKGIIARRFEGPKRALTDEDWNAILRGESPHSFDEKSLAVPAGWKAKSKD